AVEAFSNAHRMSDGYRSYFEYNLALHRLVRIVYLLRGGKRFLFLPRDFARDYLTPKEQESFRELNGKIYLKMVNQTKRALFTFFYPILKEIDVKYPNMLNCDEIINLCERLYQRDYFWNLRDIARLTPTTLKINQIYRSATLHNYVNDDYFNKWVDEKGIKSIVDLRSEKEVLESPYVGNLPNKISYYNMPFFPVVSDDQTERIEASKKQESLIEAYRWALEQKSDQIRAIFRFLSLSTNYPLVIHCYAGKDRTGIIVALIHLLLGTRKTLIIQDYLISSTNANRDAISFLIDFIEDKGGIEKYLTFIGISGDEQKEIQNLLLRSD
ncbi:MAG: tyrosine-protein phosphatase, partial [Candidatus Thorarchaeota archaeon]